MMPINILTWIIPEIHNTMLLCILTIIDGLPATCSHATASASYGRVMILQALLLEATPSTTSDMLMALPLLQEKDLQHVLN